VTTNGVLDGRGGAVVQQRPAQPEAPQRRRPELQRLGGLLPDAVAGPDVVKEQVREERHHLAVE
jgi:hypothetical protein